MLFSTYGRLHFNLFENDIEHQHRYHPGHTEQRARAERPAVDGELYPRRKPRDVDGEQRRRTAYRVEYQRRKTAPVRHGKHRYHERGGSEKYYKNRFHSC